MDNRQFKNLYSGLLKAKGEYVISVRGVDWYDSGGYMIPAYLAHCYPEINEEIARDVLKISKKLFVRWNVKFGQVTESPWWWVVKRPPWDIEQVKNKKKRWMIRKGIKNFTIRTLTVNEIISKCPDIVQAAVARYKGNVKVESKEILTRQAEASKQVPGAMEYVGCFKNDTLVSYSENHIQNNGVWLANIRHDPAYLKEYSGYALIHGLLDYYLNEKKMDYVIDGSRSIHHRTNIQEHLIHVFGFKKEYAIIKVIYSNRLKVVLKIAYPLRKLFWSLEGVFDKGIFDNIGAVLRLDKIRRTCAALNS